MVRSNGPSPNGSQSWSCGEPQCHTVPLSFLSKSQGNVLQGKEKNHMFLFFIMQLTTLILEKFSLTTCLIFLQLSRIVACMYCLYYYFFWLCHRKNNTIRLNNYIISYHPMIPTLSYSITLCTFHGTLSFNLQTISKYVYRYKHNM